MAYPPPRARASGSVAASRSPPKNVPTVQVVCANGPKSRAQAAHSTLDRAARCSELAADPFDDHFWPREHFGADPDDRPSHRFEQRDPVDVPRPLISIGPMLD